MKRMFLFLSLFAAVSSSGAQMRLLEDENFNQREIGPLYDDGAHWIVKNNGKEGVDIVNDYDDQQNYLTLQYDDAIIYWSILEGRQPEDPNKGTPALPLYSDIDDDVVFDSRLQFTVNDDPSVPELYPDSKFAIWLYGDGDTTNLYVTAGGNTLTGEYNTPTNYSLDVAVEADTWHRVTVRAIRNVSSDSHVKGDMMGFVVFIDGNPVACADEDYVDKLPTIANPTPYTMYYIERKRLFPSILCSGISVRSSQLAAAGFLGTGKVDDLSMAYAGDEDFGFAANPTLFTITWDDGVTSFTYVVNDVPVEYVTEAGVNSLTLDVTGFAMDDEISVKDIHPADWVEKDHDSATVAEGVLHISATAPNEGAFVVDSNIEVSSLVAAIAAVSDGGTIKPIRNVEENIAEYIVAEGKSFTLDLAGKNVTITYEYPDTVLYVANATITVINSIDAQGGGVLDVTDAGSLFQLYEACAVIGAAEGDAGVTVKGKILMDEYGEQRLNVVKGFFDDDSVKNCLDGNSECSSAKNEDGYWVVTVKAEEDEPMAFGEEKEYGSDAEAQAAVEAAKEGITVAWPKDSGCDAPEGWSEGDQAAYSALFTLTQDGKVVRVELKPADDDAIKDVEASLTEATQKINLGGEATSVEVDSVPGLYYGVSIGEELDAMSVDEWSIATSNKVQVAIPARDATQTSGFYRLEASPTKQD